jgi:serine/threonine-protein kinase
VSTDDRRHDAVGDPERLVGTTFADRYRLVRFAASGANTVIFDAIDTERGRGVTVKAVRPDLAVASTFRRRFDDTMRSASVLSHPNIAAIYDWGTASYAGEPTVYVVIEQLKGGSLRDLFDRGRRLSPSQALAVGLDACKALDHAHRRGFVHTELTPSKLVFGDDRRLRVVDFGLAALLGEHMWAEPATVATHVARYAAPEQGLGMPIDGRTDVYALCLGLVEAVTGEVPFAADSTVATLAARVGRLMPVSADLGPLAAVLEKAGRPDISDRSTASEFGRGLVRAAEKLPRPEPLPLLATALFEVPAERLRTPEDPTGGLTRPDPGTVGAGGPADTTGELVVIPLDEPGPVEAVETPVVEEAAAAAPLLGLPDIDLPVDVDDADIEPDIEPDVAPADGLRILVGDDPLDSSVPGVPPVPVASAPTAPPPTAPAPTAVVPATVAATATTAAAPVPPDRRRGRGLRILLGLVVLLLIGALAAVAYLLFRTPSHTVPELVGSTQDEALLQIDDFGWELALETERSDVEPRAGHVIRTSPVAGERVAEGEPFLLVVSEGPVLRSLPDATGRQLPDIQTELVELALEPSVVEQYDEVVEVGRVISWSVPSMPEAGPSTLVEPGTVVELVVSLGPEPRVVPELVGRTADAARAELVRLRLQVLELPPAFSDDVPAGNVLFQAPDPGTEVERGSEVEIVLSRGPDLIAFPDIVGLPFADARTALVEAGFEPVLVLGSSTGVVQSATIDGDDAVPGRPYRRATRVDVVAL